MAKILIIDDEVSLNKALVKVGLLNSHVVKSAFSMSEGEKLWVSFSPDIVLLDVFLPDANALQRLPGLDLRGAKLVLMSAHEKLPKVELENLKGVDLFLPKPFYNVFESFKKIEELL